MTKKIYICCCNYLFAEGMKKLIEGNDHNKDYIVKTIYLEQEIPKKTDLIIVDGHTIPSMVIASLFKQQVGILLLMTGCLPMIKDDQTLSGYVSKGLIGILPAKAGVSQLMKAIKCTIDGELWFDHKKLKDIFCSIKNGVKDNESSLTMRETEIIKTVCKGYRNKEIMKHLNISEQTVKKHLNNIYKKLGVTDRLQLALHAAKHWPFYISTT